MIKRFVQSRGVFFGGAAIRSAAGMHRMRMHSQ